MPSTDEWSNSDNPKHGILSNKNSKLLILTTTWVNLQKIMLSEKSQSQIVTYYMIPLKCPLYRNGLQISGCQE